MATVFRALTLAVLLVWVFAGPIGMAFDGCVLTCDGPCALTTASVSLGPTVAFIVDLSGIVAQASETRPSAPSFVRELPPRPSVLSA
jgi:hypothetical protein